MGLVREVALQIRVGDLRAMLGEGFQSHDLHHSLGQVADQPLL